MYKAPYDERNELDYEEITKRIDCALEMIEKGSNIPATEIKLSELAGCSRGTLRNRIYPLVRLKEIKQRRLKGQNKLKPTRLTSQQLIEVDVHIEEKKALMKQLKKSRSETAVWVNKFLELEIQLKKLERLVSVLQEAKKILEFKLSQSINPAVSGSDFVGK